MDACPHANSLFGLLLSFSEVVLSLGEVLLSFLKMLLLPFPCPLIPIFIDCIWCDNTGRLQSILITTVALMRYGEFVSVLAHDTPLHIVNWHLKIDHLFHFRRRFYRDLELSLRDSSRMIGSTWLSLLGLRWVWLDSTLLRLLHENLEKSLLSIGIELFEIVDQIVHHKPIQVILLTFHLILFFLVHILHLLLQIDRWSLSLDWGIWTLG